MSKEEARQHKGPDASSSGLSTPGAILIVEDDRILLDILATTLGGAGWECICSSSAEEASSVIENGVPVRMVLTDLGLPGMSGLDLARKLRTVYKLPFVVLTAHDEDEKIGAAVAEGALSYLLKPVDVTQLLPIIRVALARHDEQMALERALKSDRSVAIAVGMLMKQHAIPEQNAFNMLRDQARARRLKLADFAKEISKESPKVFSKAADKAT